MPRPEHARIGIREARPCQPVERLDHPDHHAVIVRSDAAADPVAGAALVGEYALPDALPVGVLEQAARDPAFRPASSGHAALAALNSAQPELKQPAALLGRGQYMKILAQPAFVLL